MHAFLKKTRSTLKVILKRGLILMNEKQFISIVFGPLYFFFNWEIILRSFIHILEVLKDRIDLISSKQQFFSFSHPSISPNLSLSSPLSNILALYIPSFEFPEILNYPKTTYKANERGINGRYKS